MEFSDDMMDKNQLNLRLFFSITYKPEKNRGYAPHAHTLFRNEISECDRGFSGFTLDGAADGFGYGRIWLGA